MSRPERKARGGGAASDQKNVSDPAGSDKSAKPVRVTVDLDQRDYDRLREFAYNERMTHADVLRALIGLLGESRVSQQVRKYGSQ